MENKIHDSKRIIIIILIRKYFLFLFKYFVTYQYFLNYIPLNVYNGANDLPWKSALTGDHFLKSTCPRYTFKKLQDDLYTGNKSNQEYSKT